MLIYSIEGLAHLCGHDAGLIRRMMRTGRLIADCAIQGGTTTDTRPGWREGKPVEDAAKTVQGYVDLRVQLKRPAPLKPKAKAKAKARKARA